MISMNKDQWLMTGVIMFLFIPVGFLYVMHGIVHLLVGLFILLSLEGVCLWELKE